LEVGAEVKYLTVILEPLRSDLGDGVVLVLGASGDASEAGGSSFTHRSEEVRVDIFLQIGCLFCDGAVLDAEQLGLVVAGDCGVAIHVSWEERQGLGHVSRFHD